MFMKIISKIFYMIMNQKQRFSHLCLLSHIYLLYWEIFIFSESYTNSHMPHPGRVSIIPPPSGGTCSSCVSYWIYTGRTEPHSGCSLLPSAPPSMVLIIPIWARWTTFCLTMPTQACVHHRPQFERFLR